MGLARCSGVVLNGVEGLVVEIEAFISQGLPGMNIVGLADTAVGESRDRVRAAISNSNLPWPGERKITIGLSPASLHKRGASLDLGIALAIMAANRKIPELVDTVVVGELALDGKVRPIRGVLVAALSAHHAGIKTLLVPFTQVSEANLVPGLTVVGVSSLNDAVAYATGVDFDLPDISVLENQTDSPAQFSELLVPDLSDVRGQPLARRALEIAAAGGHHIAMMGSPGVGKTMLAQRLPGLLPPLDDKLAVEVTAIHSAAGKLRTGQGLIRTPPFEAPHHTATTAALIGGGSNTARVGIVTLAHGGVLCVDEAAEFNRPVLDALRQPLESGVVSIARAGFQIELPARFQLVLASNPCPCGKFVGTGSECSCAPIIRRRYLARLSGPLLDRIDVRVTLNRPTLAELDSSLNSSVNAIEDTASARARVLAARARAAKRFENTPWLLNANIPGPQLRKRFPLNQKAKQLLLKSAKSFSARGIDRTIRIAWTIADLADHPEPTISDIEQALIFRDGNGSWQC
jgi:magnesium chelatase family protein